MKKTTEETRSLRQLGQDAAQRHLTRIEKRVEQISREEKRLQDERQKLLSRALCIKRNLS